MTQESSPEVSKEQEYLDGWKRARADLENLQKQTAARAVEVRMNAKREVAEEFLSLSDNFQSLIAHAPKEKDPWTEGVLHIGRQFEQVLGAVGIQKIGESGEKFDPMIHEAIEEVQDDKQPPGTVVKVVQAGYKMGDVVIRPAKVIVVATPSSRPPSRDPVKGDDVDPRVKPEDDNLN